MPDKSFKALSGIEPFKPLGNAFVAVLCCYSCNFTVVLETYSPYKALCLSCGKELEPIKSRQVRKNKSKVLSF